MSDSREDRFCALYEWTRPRIVAYALRRAPTREDAADVVAETFEIAWRKLDDVPPGQAELLWLYVTARHVQANRNRRLHRQDDLVVRLAGELQGVTAREEARDEEGLVMEACLRTLRSDDREVLMLAAWEGLRAADIGRVLGCSPTAARIRLHRARARLKDAMSAPAPAAKHSPTIRHEQDRTDERSATSMEALEQ